MELSIGLTKNEARELKQARLNRGAIEVSLSALLVAYNFVKDKKYKALDDQEFEYAATWRDNEKNILHGIADLGLAPPDSDLPVVQVKERKA